MPPHLYDGIRDTTASDVDGLVAALRGRERRRG